jgi:hypothetical protein
VFTPIPNCTDPCDSLVCNDSDLCTADSCLNGQCEFTAIACDDGDTCTTDDCVAATGCVFTPISGCTTAAATIDISHSVEIYPNPAPGVFELALSKTLKGHLHLNIFDLNGRNLHSEIFRADGNNSKTIDARELTRGIYILNLKTEEISVNKKLVIY